MAARSSNVDEERLYEAFTERIPAVDTDVFVILKPVTEKKPKTTPKSTAEK